MSKEANWLLNSALIASIILAAIFCALGLGFNSQLYMYIAQFCLTPMYAVGIYYQFFKKQVDKQ